MTNIPFIRNLDNKKCYVGCYDGAFNPNKIIYKIVLNSKETTTVPIFWFEPRIHVTLQKFIKN